jgi:hypothetical protein
LDQKLRGLPLPDLPIPTPGFSLRLPVSGLQDDFDIISFHRRSMADFHDFYIGQSSSRPCCRRTCSNGRAFSCILLLESIGIRLNILRPKLLHHEMNFMGPMIVAVFENIPQLSLIQ